MKKWVFVIPVLLVVVAVFFFLNNSTAVYNVTNQFGLTGNVVEYGKFDGDQASIITKINRDYAELAGSGKKIYFVFGDTEQVVVSTYEGILRGQVNIVSGDTVSAVPVKDEKYFSQIIKPTGERVNIVIGGETYNFKLKPDEKVYFIITQD